MPGTTLPTNPTIRRRTLREAGLLLAVAVLLAVTTWAVRSEQLPLLASADVYELELSAPVMDLDRALRAYEAGSHLFVDIRQSAPSGSSYIPGAFTIRQDSFEDDLMAASDFIYPEETLVLYGTGDLQVVAAVASRFLDRGYENIFIMSGGIDAWRRAGGPVAQTEETSGD